MIAVTGSNSMREAQFNVGKAEQLMVCTDLL